MMTLQDDVWKELMSLIIEKKCTPVIGPDASLPWIHIKNIARSWAEKYQYPLLEDSPQLPRIAQFLAINKGGESVPRNNIKRELEEIVPPNFALEKYKNTPYAVLADLNLPIYITTNYDNFMEKALRDKGKDPVSEFFVWSDELKNYVTEEEIHSFFPSTFYKSSRKKKSTEQYIPKEAQPLVYHLHGNTSIPQSMVLMESDYIDFVIYLHKEKEDEILPNHIRRALSNTSLLFFGHSIEDISFRFIFQGLMRLFSAKYRELSISVQLPLSYNDEKKKKEAHNYLEKYTKDMFEIYVHWDDISRFSEELRKRWEGFRGNR
jgi:SIR2-like domain